MDKIMVKSALAQKGLTQSDIAKLLKVSSAAVHYVVSGKKSTPRIRLAIALSLGRTVSSIWPTDQKMPVDNNHESERLGQIIALVLSENVSSYDAFSDIERVTFSLLEMHNAKLLGQGIDDKGRRAMLLAYATEFNKKNTSAPAGRNNSPVGDVARTADPSRG